MKKVLLLGVALLLVSSVVSAQELPPWGYYGWFADANATVNCASGAASTFVDAYLFVKPGNQGVSCVELRTTLLEGATMVWSTTLNDIAPPAPAGIFNVEFFACFNNCYFDWVQIGHLQLFVMNTSPVELGITNFTGSDWPKILACTGGEEYEGVPFTNYRLNCGCTGLETGTTESSWGAIKNMYE
jgi:hypothetical protein